MIDQFIPSSKLIQTEFQLLRRFKFILLIRIRTEDNYRKVRPGHNLLQLSKAGGEKWIVVFLPALLNWYIDGARGIRRMLMCSGLRVLDVQRPPFGHMNAQCGDRMIITGQSGSPVPLVGIPVDHPDLFHKSFRLQPSYSYNDIVDEAETVSEISMGMVKTSPEEKTEPLRQGSPHTLEASGGAAQLRLEQPGERFLCRRG